MEHVLSHINDVVRQELMRAFPDVEERSLLPDMLAAAADSGYGQFLRTVIKLGYFACCGYYLQFEELPGCETRQRQMVAI